MDHNTWNNGVLQQSYRQLLGGVCQFVTRGSERVVVMWCNGKITEIVSSDIPNSVTVKVHFGPDDMDNDTEWTLDTTECVKAHKYKWNAPMEEIAVRFGKSHLAFEKLHVFGHMPRNAAIFADPTRRVIRHNNLANHIFQVWSGFYM